VSTNGRRKWLPTRGTPEEAHADALLARIKREAGTLASGMEAVRADCIARGLRPATLRWYEKRWAVIAKRFPLDTPLEAITTEALQAWVDERSERLAPSTVIVTTKALRRVYRLLELPDPTAKVLMPRRDETELDPYTRAEVFELAERCSPRMRLLVLLLFLTGLRRTELAEVVPAEHVRGGTLLVVHGKMRPRALPLPDRTRALLGAWEPPPSESQRQRAKWVSKQFEVWKPRLEADHRFRPHNLRHSLGAHLARSGVGEHVIGTILGHKASARSMTSHYMRAYGSDVRAALELAWEG
jgi:integrase